MEQELQPKKQIRPAIGITIIPKVTILNGIQCPKINVTILNKALSLLESSNQIKASDTNLVYIAIPNDTDISKIYQLYTEDHIY